MTDEKKATWEIDNAETDDEETKTDKSSSSESLQKKIDLGISNFFTIRERTNDTLKRIAEDVLSFRASFQVQPYVIESIKHFNESFKKMISSAINISSMVSPFIDWIRSIDLSPITSQIKAFQSGLQVAFDRFEQLSNIYYQTMYETKWFPYTGWNANIALFSEINEIIRTSRGASKRREQRIDKAILSYYSDDVIKKLKKKWWKTDLDFCIRKMHSQAIDAFLRGEYALTIATLSTMWEGLIYIKATNAPASKRKRQRDKITKAQLNDLVSINKYKQIFSDYYDNWIVSDCNSVADVVDGVPNRHGVAHSWYKKYPNRKAALNAILLTDFIISLKPLEQTEVQNND